VEGQAKRDFNLHSGGQPQMWSVQLTNEQRQNLAEMISNPDLDPKLWEDAGIELLGEELS